MKKIIKLTSIILSVVILVSIFSINSSAAGVTYKNYEGFVYTSNSDLTDGIHIKNYKGTKSSITIPDIIEEKDVKIVVLGNKTKAKSVVLPKSAEYIRVSQAPNLTKISIKDNPKYKTKNNMLLNHKGTVLHSVAGGLKTVKVPKDVKKIFHNAFRGSQVEKVVLAENFERFDTYAFAKCKKLKKVVLYNRTKAPKIGVSAFEDIKNTVSFYVENEKIAKTLKNRLNKKGPENYKIYVAKKTYNLYS